MYSFHLVYMHFPALVVSAQEVSGSDGRKKGGGGPNHTAELCAFCLVSALQVLLHHIHFY